MSRVQYFGLLSLVALGVVVVAAINSSAQKVEAPKASSRPAFGGAGPDILHMGPYLEVKGTESLPVLYSSQPALFRVYNDGEQAVRIVGGASGKEELARIEPGKFQYVGDTRMNVVGTEKDKVTTVYFVIFK
jgi:hypothetical protein